MLPEIPRQHQDDGNLYKLRWLKLTQRAGQPDPAALAVDLHSDSGYQYDDQQPQSQHIKDRGEFNQTAIVAESDRQHRYQRNTQTDKLLLPIGLGRLRIMNLPSAKANNGDSQHADQPVKISKFTSLHNGNHNQKAV